MEEGVRGDAPGERQPLERGGSRVRPCRNTGHGDGGPENSDTLGRALDFLRSQERGRHRVSLYLEA